MFFATSGAGRFGEFNPETFASVSDINGEGPYCLPMISVVLGNTPSCFEIIFCSTHGLGHPYQH